MPRDKHCHKTNIATRQTLSILLHSQKMSSKRTINESENGSQKFGRFEPLIQTSTEIQHDNIQPNKIGQLYMRVVNPFKVFGKAILFKWPTKTQLNSSILSPYKTLYYVGLYDKLQNDHDEQQNDHVEQQNVRVEKHIHREMPDFSVEITESCFEYLSGSKILSVLPIEVKYAEQTAKANKVTFGANLKNASIVLIFAVNDLDDNHYDLAVSINGKTINNYIPEFNLLGFNIRESYTIKPESASSQTSNIIPDPRGFSSYPKPPIEGPNPPNLKEVRLMLKRSQSYDETTNRLHNKTVPRSIFGNNTNDID